MATDRRDGVQVLSRAALLLRELSVAPEGLTPIALADRAGLPRSTCYRIVGALCDEGFMRMAPSGKLHIGAGLIGIAAASCATRRSPISRGSRSNCTRPSSSSSSMATRRCSPTSTSRSARCAW